MGEEDLCRCHDDDGMLTTAAAVSSRKLLTDSNSAYGSSSYQQAPLTACGTHRRWTPAMYHCATPFHDRLQRCSSERGPDHGGFLAAQYRSCAELDGGVGASTFHRGPPLPRPARRRTTSHMYHSATINPLQRKDIFYSGSVVSLRCSMMPGGLHSRQNVETAGLEVPRESMELATTVRRSLCAERCSTLLVMLDVTLLRNCAFIVICVSSAFIQLGYFVPVVFLTPYTRSLKLTTSDAALFLSVIGRLHIMVYGLCFRGRFECMS